MRRDIGWDSDRSDEAQEKELKIVQSEEYQMYVRSYPNVLVANLDLKTIYVLYTFCHPGSTQADFAKLLGTSQMTLSRALSSEERVRNEWAHLIPDILITLPTASFDETYRLVLEAKQGYERASTRFLLSKFILDYLISCEKISPQAELEEFGTGNSFCLTDKKNKSTWVFWDLDSANGNNDFTDYLGLFSKLEGLGGREKTDHITLFTRSDDVFHTLIDRYFATNDGDVASMSKCYRSIMVLNNYYYDVEREFVLPSFR